MTIEIKIPDIGVDEVEVIDILVKVGDIVKIEESLIIVEGDKAAMEVPSPCDGIVCNIIVKVGDKVKTSSVIMFFQEKSDLSIENNMDVNKKSTNYIFNLDKDEKNFICNNKMDSLDKLVHASPLIRKLAREKNINLSCITGSGPKNRIIKEDIEKYLSESIHSDITFNDKLKEPCIQNQGNKILSLSKIQIVSGKNLSNNWKNIPHVTHFDLIDVTDLDNFRKKYNLDMKKKNIKITLLPFIIKFVVKALEYFPIFNSSIDMINNQVILKKDINIGVVVNTKDGLLIPILKNIQNKSILNISNELQDLSNKARIGKLTLPDLSGGTFTISNLGTVRGSFFTPIINSSEVAILGLSKCSMQSIFDGMVFNPRLMLPISFSYDHRVINGVDAANFIHFINQYVLDIRLLIM
ncbi:MAG: 2-oxo acid dehydrogenase subunit E2 [Buchnera aphidicola (Eriosoma harunire)]